MKWLKVSPKEALKHVSNSNLTDHIKGTDIRRFGNGQYRLLKCEKGQYHISEFFTELEKARQSARTE